jgi:hypothetical protein
MSSVMVLFGFLVGINRFYGQLEKVIVMGVSQIHFFVCSQLCVPDVGTQHT